MKKHMKQFFNKRLYNAGKHERMAMSWDSANYTPDQVSTLQLKMLRGKARHQARNNDYVNRLIQVLQNNIIGSAGFKLRSQIEDEKKRELIQARWANYCDEIDFVSIQNLIVSSLLIDGEAFIYFGVDEHGQLKIKLIDADRIDTQFNDQDKRIIMGIEYDTELEPIAYWLNDISIDPMLGNSSTSRTRIDAKHIKHIFKIQFVGQKRGVPWIAPSLNKLYQLEKFEEAALMAARIGAAKMGFFYSENDLEYTGADDDMNLQCEPGTFENIGSMRFEQFDPQYPAGEFKVFVEKILMGISSGWGVDYHTIANDFSGVNYSSARVGMLETREYYKKLQSWLILQVIKPTFKKWLQLEIFRGAIPNKPIEFYLPASFVGRRWEWVDPQKEATAKKTLLEMGAISLSQIIRERGDDPADVFEEINTEKN